MFRKQSLYITLIKEGQRPNGETKESLQKVSVKNKTTLGWMKKKYERLKIFFRSGYGYSGFKWEYKEYGKTINSHYTLCN